MTDKEIKGQLRKLALSNRDALDEQYRKRAAESAAKKILFHPAVQNAEVIMIYMSFRSELDTVEIVEN